MNLQIHIITHIVQAILKAPTDSKINCSWRDLVFDIEIKESYTSRQWKDDIWDNTYVNGKWTGNRCGAIHQIADTIEKRMEEIIKDGL